MSKGLINKIDIQIDIEKKTVLVDPSADGYCLVEEEGDISQWVLIADLFFGVKYMCSAHLHYLAGYLYKRAESDNNFVLLISGCGIKGWEEQNTKKIRLPGHTPKLPKLCYSKLCY